MGVNLKVVTVRIIISREHGDHSCYKMRTLSIIEDRGVEKELKSKRKMLLSARALNDLMTPGGRGSGLFVTSKFIIVVTVKHHIIIV